MTEPVRTRSDVEREVREALPWMEFFKDAAMKRVHEQVSAALLAMAECKDCDGESLLVREGPGRDGPVIGEALCRYCHGTGLDQSRLARGLNALLEDYGMMAEGE